MCCDPLALKHKGKASTMHLLSLGPGKQVAPCPVIVNIPFPQDLSEHPSFPPPRELSGFQGLRQGSGLWGLPCS